MLIDSNNFSDIKGFIQHLKSNDNVIGIVEYGGRTYSDTSDGGDYDLTVIFDKPVSKNFTGLHFHIGGIPIDCMLLSKEDFEMDNPLNEFLLVHLNCKIIYDKDGMTEALIKRISTMWKRSGELSDSEIMMYRFSFKHILDKLKYRLHDNELYTKFFVFSSMDWYLSCYANIKGWEIGKPKLHLTLIKDNEAILYELIDKLYSGVSLEEQYDLLEEIAEYMLINIGGLWREDEVLFHLNPEGVNSKQEQEELLKILFN